ncbi:6688802f-91b9-475c-9813-8d2fdf3b3046 [Thermothielavioides terrestris]|uniref:1-phosphatidylinositol-4-phosphate 5-kinase n=1 Tax=Thermothielavioides terrestris TaxID=2587410 RepID=A0A3S4ASC7_9PEZI|nr:6688802f-91b9-475c-9813-8d2fdf3b3046 [Thermothielavioides terrestris]
MPSFLPDATTAIDSQSSGTVYLDGDAEYALSQSKVNEPIARQPHSQSHTSNDSFDGSSAKSTSSSITSETSLEPDQQLSRNLTSSPRSMNSPPTAIAGGGENGRGTVGSVTRKPLQLDNSAPLVDRTVPGSTTGARGCGSAGHKQNDHAPSHTTPTAEELLPQQPGVEVYLHPVAKGDVRTVENGSPRPPAPVATSPASAAQQSPATSQKSLKAPHRYSSPPVYDQAAAGPSGNLQSPTVPGARHRHTLEVPKITPAGRGSRDGPDTAVYASGRFSPTMAATGPRRASLSLARRTTRSLHSDGPRDEVVPDEDALRWAEAYRQKRASKRRRRELEDDDRVLVGTKVDESHANWVTAYNMLTGIRVSVSRTNAKVDRPLTDADFEVKQKSTFDIAGNELVPSAKYDFKFKDYAPWVFRHLRALFRLDPADYLISLTGKYILSELGSPGKSGSFFYFSRDYKYIIKTIHHAEHKFLRQILKDYYQHVKENPNTLLSQFYGLHRVKMPYGRKIHFVVMNNLFPPHRDIHQTFDLKGSTVGRDYKEEDLEKNPRATLKDLNWLRRKRHLELGLQKKQLFLAQLQKDVRLLQRLQIMDYSLLVGIHDVQRGNEENLRDKTLRVFNPGGSNTPEDFDPNSVLMRTPSKLENQRKARELRQMIQSEKPVPMGETSSRMPDELEEGHSRPGFIFNQDDGGFRATHEDNAPGDEIYYLGVIDCLTHYGIIKKIEHFWKGLSSDRSQISALPPQEYGERFINFISNVTMSQEEALRVAQEREAAQAAEPAAAVPPVPNYQPPLPPSSSSLGQRPADAQPGRVGTIGEEEDVPNRTLRTVVTGPTPSGKANHGPSASVSERRETTVLPVVEEAAEGPSTGDRSRNSRVSSLLTESDGRPLTPAKDGDEMEPGFGNPILGVRNGSKGSNGMARPPPTPPKTGQGFDGRAKPDSADSGYGIGSGSGSTSGSNGGLKSLTGSQKSLNIRPQISRDSLDKALPPLPKVSSSRPHNVS